MATKLPAAARDAFDLDMAAKFMATLNTEGEPNIAPVITTYPWDDETLIFGDFLIRKTKENLLREKESPVSVAVMTLGFSVFEVQGRFLGFETKGPKFDRMSSKDLFRYSAIGLLRSVGTIAVDKVRAMPMSKMGIASEWLTTRMAAKRPKDAKAGLSIHPVVRAKVGVLNGAKFLAVARGPLVEQFPVLCLQPAGHDHVVFRTKLVSDRRKSLKTGDSVAISVFTMDPQAYQLKGKFVDYRRVRGFEVGLVNVTSVWTQVPPIPGAEIIYRG
ncbi:MAG: hypothetical protein C4K47_07650 [Candidatus Thorarchaeota archaeon]|nr:MAG: hypothetical protein C4K47_07650 [Candidatus Thorarchaeota archaeon]